MTRTVIVTLAALGIVGQVLGAALLLVRADFRSVADAVGNALG